MARVSDNFGPDEKHTRHPSPPPAMFSTSVRILRMRQLSQQTGKFGLSIERRHVCQILQNEEYFEQPQEATSHT